MTESTNHLRTLVDLNNEAVAAFRKGQTELARAKMKEAVQWSQQILRCEENCDDKVSSSLSANEKYFSFSSRAATTMTDRDMIVLLVRAISIDDNGLNSDSGPFSTGQEDRHPPKSILDRKYRLPFQSMATSCAMFWPKSYFTNMFVVHIQMRNEEEEKSLHQNGGSRVTFESHPSTNQRQTRRSAAYTKDHEDAFTTIVSCVLFNTALACQCLSRQSRNQQGHFKSSEHHQQKAMRLYQLCISTLLMSTDEEEPSSSHDQARNKKLVNETGNNPLGSWRSSDDADSERNPPLSSRRTTRRMPPEEEQQQDYLQDAFTNEESRSLADKKRFILAACLINLYMATFVKETPASAST